MEPHQQPPAAGRIRRGRRPFGAPPVDIDGSALFAARRQQMITIDRMVERIDQLGWSISGATLRNYETEQSKPTSEFVPVLSKAYGVPLPRLVRVDPFAAIQAAPVEVPPNDEAKIREVLDDIMAMIAELKGQQS
jgi:hypothetical protein